MAESSDDLEKLKLKLRKLEKINAVLMKRVENSMSVEQSAFSVFEGNILLEKKVREKTQELDQKVREIERLDSALNRVFIVFEIDLKGNITSANEKFLSFGNYTAGEVIGQSAQNLFGGAVEDYQWEIIWETINSKKVFQGEIQVELEDGEIWLESTFFPNIDSDGNIKNFTSICLDTTAKKMNEIKFAHQAKLASIGQLAAGVAHELNNPLAIAMGCMTVIKRELAKNDSLTELIEKRLNNANISHGRIRTIIDSLKIYSRDDKDNFDNFFLVQKVEDAISFLYEIYAHQGIIFHKIYPGEDFKLFGVPGKVQQVIINLLDNAKDATEGQESRVIKLTIQKSDEFAEILVSDNGPGIPVDIKEKIFEPFFTTKEVGRGTGLGLGLVMEIVRLHNGEISVDSGPEKGTTFKVNFPLQKPD